MGEVVNVIVAFALIVFLFRWVTSPSTNDPTGERSAAQVLGFRPKNVTQDMVDTIHSMFPDMPKDNIRYDLLRTGNVELTSNKILEKGFLEAPPPPYYTLYPRTDIDPNNINAAAVGTATGTRTPATKAPTENLISRYQLQDRISTTTTSSASDGVVPSLEQLGGKAAWEDSAEKREASLKERKAQMILAARQRLLAQQQQRQS